MMSYLVVDILIHAYVFGSRTSYLSFSVTCEQYYITHELISSSLEIA